MSNEILIHLDSTELAGGEVVQGELELKLDTAIPFRGVRILFHGYERSYWGKDIGKIKSSGTGKRLSTHSETRDLFKQEVTLFGDAPLDTASLITDSVSGLFSSDHYHRLEPGSYRYPFTFQLPKQLPGNYSDSADRSKIAYSVKGYLDVPMKFDIEQTVSLTIHEPHIQSTVQPVSASNKKIMFESDDFVEMQATLDKNMCLPGETVNCHLAIQNRSGQKVQAVIVELVKVETLQAQEMSTTKVEQIHTKRFENINIPHGDAGELDLQFNIPGELYPSITSSRLVNVQYQLVFNLELPWKGFDIPLAINLGIEVPVILLDEKTT